MVSIYFLGTKYLNRNKNPIIDLDRKTKKVRFDLGGKDSSNLGDEENIKLGDKENDDRVVKTNSENLGDKEHRDQVVQNNVICENLRQKTWLNRDTVEEFKLNILPKLNSTTILGDKCIEVYRVPRKSFCFWILFDEMVYDVEISVCKNKVHIRMQEVRETEFFVFGVKNKV